MNKQQNSLLAERKSLAFELYQQLLNDVKLSYGLDLTSEGWQLSFNHRRRALGLCHFKRRRIELSVPFLMAGSELSLQRTLSHEVAHAVAGRLHQDYAHGRHWRRIDIALGGSGQRCSDQAEIDEDKMAAGYRYQLVDSRTGRVIRGFYRKPRRDYSRCYLPGDRGSLGKLVVEALS